jgi:hypothetical protein
MIRSSGGIFARLVGRSVGDENVNEDYSFIFSSVSQLRYIHVDVAMYYRDRLAKPSR